MSRSVVVSWCAAKWMQAVVRSGTRSVVAWLEAARRAVPVMRYAVLLDAAARLGVVSRLCPAAGPAR